MIDPLATASRLVTGLAETSTILTRPWRSTCDRPLRALGFFTVPPREIERQAFERHGKIHAFQFHVGRHLECARREIQYRLDAGRDHEIHDPLCRGGGHGDDSDADAVAARELLQIVDVVNRYAAPSAQRVVDLVIASGIKAVLNFSPGTLQVPADVKLKSVDLTVSLESLSFYLARGDGEET